MEIRDFQFGQIWVQGQICSKDLKICGEELICPWWRKKGHQVDVDDVQDLIALQPETIVLGMGTPGLMKATANLKKTLQQRGLRLVEIPTPEAVQEYTRLSAQGQTVGLGLHLFC